MELLYTTDDLAVANKLSARLTAASIANYISGEQTMHFLGGRTPGAISIWIHNAEDFENAHKVMLKIGYILPLSNEPRPNLKNNRILVVILAAVFILIMGVVIGSAP